MDRIATATCCRCAAPSAAGGGGGGGGSAARAAPGVGDACGGGAAARSSELTKTSPVECSVLSSVAMHMMSASPVGRASRRRAGCCDARRSPRISRRDESAKRCQAPATTYAAAPAREEERAARAGAADSWSPAGSSARATGGGSVRRVRRASASQRGVGASIWRRARRDARGRRGRGLNVGIVPLLCTGVPTRHDKNICRCFGAPGCRVFSDHLNTTGIVTGYYRLFRP